LNGAGNAELACAIKKAGGESVANAAIANHETEDGPERVVSAAAARRLLGLMDAQVRKRHFLSHLYIKCIILPRQARDEHRENSKKVPFSLSALSRPRKSVAMSRV
jgi:hypothetical protein